MISMCRALTKSHHLQDGDGPGPKKRANLVSAGYLIAIRWWGGGGTNRRANDKVPQHHVDADPVPGRKKCDVNHGEIGDSHLFRVAR
jgi:hypothetical protein